MTREFLLGVAERAVASYLYAVLAFVAADGFEFASMGAWKIALVSALPALLSVIKSAFTRYFGDPESGSFVL